MSRKTRIATALLLAAAAVGMFSAAAVAADPQPRTVYLIRHGEYDHQDLHDEDVGRGLVPLGREQAAVLAERLAALPIEFTGLQSSTMTRARETADIIGERLGMTPDRHRDIRECTPPTWREDIMAELEEADGEPCAELLEQAFARIFTPAEGAPAHDLVVCHGNVIRWFVCKTLKVEPMAWLGMSIANCSLTVVRVKPDGSLKLLSFADTGHLPPEMVVFPGGWKPYAEER